MTIRLYYVFGVAVYHSKLLLVGGEKGGHDAHRVGGLIEIDLFLLT